MRIFAACILTFFFIISIFPSLVANEVGERQNIQRLEYAYLPANSMLYEYPVESNNWYHSYNEKSGSLISKTDTVLAEQYMVAEYWFPLGTDNLGRGFWSRLIIGGQVSLGLGVLSILLSTIIGIIIGSIAGYFNQVVDNTIMYFLQVFWSIPTILLALTISLILGKGMTSVILAIGLTVWIDLARVVRSLVKSLNTQEYIQAAKMLGLPAIVIIIRHMLPNILRPSLILIVSAFSTAILLEAGLGFIGLSVPKPLPSWGSLLSDFRNFMLFGNPLLPLAPGIAIALTVFSCYILGQFLRDKLDVNMR